MTYLVYTAWILAMVLAAGELDKLLARHVYGRLKISFPESPSLTSGFLSMMLPGLGQFMNGQPIKALFLMIWPFLTLYGYPVPRPWQMLALKTGWILLPWWTIAVADALLVGYLLHRRRLREQQSPEHLSNTVDYYSYLANRNKQNRPAK